MAGPQRAGLGDVAAIDRAVVREAFRQVAPTLFVNPPDDRVFAARVRSAYLSGGRTPEDLQDALRTVYPDVVVRRRDLAGEVFVVWYVYRDGHWTPRKPAGASSRDG